MDGVRMAVVFIVFGAHERVVHRHGRPAEAGAGFWHLVPECEPRRAGHVRYQMLESIREYAAEKLGDDGSAATRRCAPFSRTRSGWPWSVGAVPKGELGLQFRCRRNAARF